MTTPTIALIQNYHANTQVIVILRKSVEEVQVILLQISFTQKGDNNSFILKSCQEILSFFLKKKRPAYLLTL